MHEPLYILNTLLPPSLMLQRNARKSKRLLCKPNATSVVGIAKPAKGLIRIHIKFDKKPVLKTG